MAEQTEASERRRSLDSELTKMIADYGKWAKANYLIAYLLIVFATVASIAAGLLGFMTGINPKLVGAIALIPSLIAMLFAQIKPQDRANWHHRKKDALKGLRNALRYELPDPWCSDDIAKISKSVDSLNVMMSSQWESGLSFSVEQMLKLQQKRSPVDKVRKGSDQHPSD